MEQNIDHTAQVEKRVTAIPVSARDICGFFAPRTSALSLQRECFFCLYGKFTEGEISANSHGFCKFKR